MALAGEQLDQIRSFFITATRKMDYLLHGVKFVAVVPLIIYGCDSTPRCAIFRRTSCITTYRTVRIVVAYRLGILGSADFLLGGVNLRKNDYQSFFLRLQVIRPNPEGTRSKSADREVQIPRNSRSEKRKNTP